MRAPRAVIAVASAMAMALALGACGAPDSLHTLRHEPDTRLPSVCTAIDAKVKAEIPGLTLDFSDDQCAWGHSAGATAAPVPDLIVGHLDTIPGGDDLDRTVSDLHGVAAVAGVGDRAAFDPQTRTLYVLQSGRLWYLQVVGPSTGAAPQKVLITLGRALVSAPPAA